jgi:hypothetical protein
VIVSLFSRGTCNARLQIIGECDPAYRKDLCAARGDGHVGSEIALPIKAYDYLTESSRRTGTTAGVAI